MKPFSRIFGWNRRRVFWWIWDYKRKLHFFQLCQPFFSTCFRGKSKLLRISSSHLHKLASLVRINIAVLLTLFFSPAKSTHNELAVLGPGGSGFECGVPVTRFHESKALSPPNHRFINGWQKDDDLAWTIFPPEDNANPVVWKRDQHDFIITLPQIFLHDQYESYSNKTISEILWPSLGNDCIFFQASPEFSTILEHTPDP